MIVAGPDVSVLPILQLFSLLPPQTKLGAKLCFKKHLSLHRVGVCMMSLPVWPEGSLLGGGLCPGQTPQDRPPDKGPPRMVESGRYASYWNAFLFSKVLMAHSVSG